MRERPSPVQNMYRTFPNIPHHLPEAPTNSEKPSWPAQSVRKPSGPAAIDRAHHPKSLPDASPSQLIRPRSIQQNYKGSCAYGVTGRGTEVGDATGTIPSNDIKSHTHEDCSQCEAYWCRRNGGTPGTTALAPRFRHRTLSKLQAPPEKAGHAAACELESLTSLGRRRKQAGQIPIGDF